MFHQNSHTLFHDNYLTKGELSQEKIGRKLQSRKAAHVIINLNKCTQSSQSEVATLADKQKNNKLFAAKS